MTTPCCQNKIEIHTDPKNARYIIVEGAKQKVYCSYLLPMVCCLFCRAIPVPYTFSSL